MEISKNKRLFDIISHCRENGVSRLKTDEFEFELYEWVNEKSVHKKYCPEDYKKENPETPNAIDRELVEEMRLSQLMIDDPFAFEREIITSENRRFLNEDHEN